MPSNATVEALTTTNTSQSSLQGRLAEKSRKGKKARGKQKIWANGCGRSCGDGNGPVPKKFGRRKRERLRRGLLFDGLR
jgi:hypothetical protein